LLSFGYALITALLWSLNPAFISRYRNSLQPILFTGLRALLALLPAVVFCSLAGFNAEVTSYSLALFVVSALIGPGVGDAAYTKAIQILGGGRAVVVAYTYIFVAQALSVIAGEALKPGTVVGAVLAFLRLFISTPRNSGESRASLRGFGYAATASACWGNGNRVEYYVSPLLRPCLALGD